MDRDWIATAKTLSEALPYLQRYSGAIVVVKFGGNAMGAHGVYASCACTPHGPPTNDPRAARYTDGMTPSPARAGGCLPWPAAQLACARINALPLASQREIFWETSCGNQLSVVGKLASSHR